MTRSAFAFATSPQPNVHSWNRFVSLSGWVGLSDGSWTSGERRIERLLDGEHRRQLLVVDADEPRGLFGGVLRFGRDGRDRFAEELRLADGQHRTVRERRTVARHRLRQVGGREHDAHALHGQRGGRDRSR